MTTLFNSVSVNIYIYIKKKKRKTGSSLLFGIRHLTIGNAFTNSDSFHVLIRFPSVRPRINVAPFRSFVRDVNREFGFSLRTFRDYSRGGFLCSVDMHLPSDRQAGFLKGDPMTVIRYLTDTGRCVGYETRVSRGRRAPPLLEYLSICVRNRPLPIRNERPALSRQLSTFRALFFVNRNWCAPVNFSNRRDLVLHVRFPSWAKTRAENQTRYM